MQYLSATLQPSPSSELSPAPVSPSARQPVEYLRTNGRSYGVETCLILSGALGHPIAIRADHIEVHTRFTIRDLLLIRSARHRGLMTSRLKLNETQFANRCNLECGRAGARPPTEKTPLELVPYCWCKQPVTAGQAHGVGLPPTAV